MVKVITCRTLRLPSPLPFNSLLFSFLLLYRLFFSCHRLLYLSLSLLPFFPFCLNTPILPSSLSVNNQIPVSLFLTLLLGCYLIWVGVADSLRQRLSGGIDISSW